MSTTQTITTAAEIPKVLEQFYLGTGTKGQPGYAPGLIGRGVAEIFRQTPERPEGLTGAEAYQEQYAPLFQAGLMGRGSVAGLSPFQEAIAWEFIGTSRVFSGSEPPINPVEGQQWERNGTIYTYYFDGDNYAWVEF